MRIIVLNTATATTTQQQQKKAFADFPSLISHLLLYIMSVCVFSFSRRFFSHTLQHTAKQFALITPNSTTTYPPPPSSKSDPYATTE